MIVLSIDPGFRAGFAVLDDYKVLAYGIIDVGETDPIPVRCENLRLAVISLIHNWKPDKGVIEEFYSFRALSNGFHTSKTIGAISSSFALLDVELHYYSPSTTKSIVPKPVKPKPPKRGEPGYLTPAERKAFKEAHGSQEKPPKAKRWSPSKQDVLRAVNARLGTSYAFPDSACHQSDAMSLAINLLDGKPSLYPVETIIPAPKVPKPRNPRKPKAT